MASDAAASPAAEREEAPDDERLMVLKRTACLKLQSLWKGHQMRSLFAPSIPRFQVVEVHNLRLTGLSARTLGQLRARSTRARYIISVWNLATSVRVFKWKSVWFEVESNSELRPRNARFVLPGIDENCVLSITLHGVPSLQSRKGDILFKATLIDLDIFEPHFLVEREKEISVQATSQFKLQNKATAEECAAPEEERIVFSVRSTPHSYCGWLWATRDPQKSSVALSARSNTSKGREHCYDIPVVPPISESILSLAGTPEESEHQMTFGPSRVLLRRLLRSIFGATPKPGDNVVHPTQFVAHVDGREMPADGTEYDSFNPKPEEPTAANFAPPNQQFKVTWPWWPFWAALFDGKLFLYKAYGVLVPDCTVSASCSVVTSFLFSKSSECAEFEIAVSQDSSTFVVHSPDERHHLSAPHQMPIHCVAASRAQAVSWVTKLKSSRPRELVA